MNHTATQQYAQSLVAAWPRLSLELDWIANAERIRAAHVKTNAARAMWHLIDQTSRNPPTRSSIIEQAQWHEAEAAIVPRHNPHGDWEEAGQRRERAEHRAKAAELRAWAAL